jgi:CheY-like chemotaxis protein
LADGYGDVTFCVEVPATDAAPLPDTDAMPPRTILLVEDDEDSRTVYRSMLRYHGYLVLEAMDGAEGIRLAQEHRPDAIVMDLGLPVLDGWSATEALKRSPDTAAIPVVAVTVHVQETYRSRCAAVGCDSFLEKPCPPGRLLDEIERHF